MKTIENYLNIIHFCFYKAHYKLHLFANKVNPFRALAETSFIKKRLEEKGVMNLQKEIDKAFGDKTFGLSTTVAGGILFGFLGIFFFSLLILFNLIGYAAIPHIIGCCVISGAICYFFVFRDDKYLKYFDEYEKLPKVKRWKYYWLTLMSIFILSVLFYIGLIT